MSLKDNLQAMAEELANESAAQSKDTIAWFGECRALELKARTDLWEHRETVFYSSDGESSWTYSDVALGGTQEAIQENNWSFDSDVMESRHETTWMTWRLERRSLVVYFEQAKAAVARAREGVKMEDLPVGCYIRFDVREGTNAISRWGFITAVSNLSYTVAPAEHDRNNWSTATMRVSIYCCNHSLSAGGRNVLLLAGPSHGYDDLRGTLLDAREKHAKMDRDNHEMMRKARVPRMETAKVIQKALEKCAAYHPATFTRMVNEVEKENNGTDYPDPETNTWFLSNTQAVKFARSKAVSQATSEWLRGART